MSAEYTDLSVSCQEGKIAVSTRTRPGSARQQILQAAGELFFKEGCRAIGVDTVVEHSGVAKMTLYRHFASKDELLVAYLQEANEQFWGWFESAASQSEDGRQQLLAVFTALEGWLANPQCFGCPFINAGGEFSDPNHPVHKAALAHKQAVRERLRSMAEAARAHAPDVLADQLLLLMDGGYVQARLYGSTTSPAQHIAAAAAALIAAQVA